VPKLKIFGGRLGNSGPENPNKLRKLGWNFPKISKILKSEKFVLTTSTIWRKPINIILSAVSNQVIVDVHLYKIFRIVLFFVDSLSCPTFASCSKTHQRWYDCAHKNYQKAYIYSQTFDAVLSKLLNIQDKLGNSACGHVDLADGGAAR